MSSITQKGRLSSDNADKTTDEDFRSVTGRGRPAARTVVSVNGVSVMRRVGRTVWGLLFVAAVSVCPSYVRAEGVQWVTNPPQALQQSAKTGRPVLMKFTADWCGYCKKMERTTFADPEVASAVHRDFIPLLIDADKHGQLTKELKVRGLPALLIVAPDLTILERITGFQTSERLLPKLKAVIAAHQPDRVPALPAAQQRTTTVQVERNPFEGPAAEQNPFEAESFSGNPFEMQEAAPPTEDFGFAQQKPAAPQQPSFNGLCLTSVVDKRELIAGDARFSATHKGQLLYFHSAAQRDSFFVDPDRYWPMLDGLCAGTWVDSGREVPGQLQHAAVFRGRIWVFADRALMEQFIASPADHVTAVEQRQKRARTASRF